MERSAEVRGRLLEAAGEEFAAHGFEAASVRAICERAGANISAINYYFRSKSGLYRETVAEAYHRALDHFERPGGGSAAEDLRAYITDLLAAPSDGWAYRLMARDALLGQATPADPAQRLGYPRLEQLRGILQRACPEADERRLDALALGVIGQSLCYRLARPLAARVLGAKRLAELDVDYAAQHITVCCLAVLGLAPPLGPDGEPQ